MQTCSDLVSASTIARKAGSTQSNESGKLIPSRRGHESQVAACGSHSAGMRYPNARGFCSSLFISENVQLQVIRPVAAEKLALRIYFCPSSICFNDRIAGLCASAKMASGGG